MKIIDKFLPDDQYQKQVTKKTMIFLHHTAGGHRADRQVDYWAKDNYKSVATAYIIGGVSTTDGNKDFDGKIYRAFEDKYWAYHLGLKTAQNVALNKGSVGIEVCNYGPLKLLNGEYINYVNREVPESMAYKTAQKFKGFDYYHKYTDAQLTSLKELLIKIANEHSINIKKKWDFDSFRISPKALQGEPGLWTHVSVRLDKFDMSPQPELIDMLNSI